jgi:hypothetical protein
MNEARFVRALVVAVFFVVLAARTPSALCAEVESGQRGSNVEKTIEGSRALVPFVLPGYLLQVRCSSGQGTKKGAPCDGSKAVDGLLSTAWSEAVKGDGQGEWLEVRLPAPREIESIRVYNGYQKNLSDTFGDRWPRNQRVKELEVSWDGGSKRITLPDSRDQQQIPIGVKTGRIRLSIRSVYRAEYADTCLSEIEVVLPAGAQIPSVAIPASISMERAALILGAALATGETAAVLPHLDFSVGPFTWSDCRLSDGPDGAQGWKPLPCDSGKKGASTLLKTAADFTEVFEYLTDSEGREVAILEVGPVDRCRKGRCDFEETEDDSEAKGRIREVTLRKTGGRWVLTGWKLVAYR